VQSVLIITKVVSSNLAHGEVYSIQHYVIKFAKDLQKIGGFLWVLISCGMVIVSSDGSPLSRVCLYPPLLNVLVLYDGSPLCRTCLYPQLDVLVLSGGNPLI